MNGPYVASVVASYWIISISMVYLNKVLLSNDEISVSDAPLFVTWYQCVITAFICWLAGLCGQRVAQQSYKPVATTIPEEISNHSASLYKRQRPNFFSQFPPAEYNVDTARRIFPLSLIFVGMITFNNLCLKHVEVSFYNVARRYVLRCTTLKWMGDR
jgi:GDP-fucose transporter C1